MAAVIHHPAYGRYDFGESHPFTPARLEILMDLMTELGRPVRAVRPSPASREEVLLVHDEAYVSAVERLSAPGALAGEDSLAWGLGTPDNPIFEGMDEAARFLVGGTLAGARAIAEGREARVLQLGGGLHHAHRRKASGFCLYNDLGVAIRDLTNRGLYVAYLDIDLHHGDGVQALFYNDDKVMTISLHESGQYLFPGSGDIHELGEAGGRGLKVNVPLEPFTEGSGYLEAFEEVVPQALAWFKPGILVVQAGADAHFDDPLGDLALTTRDYETLFGRILDLADAHAKGRVLFTLGGGYSVKAAPRIWAILAHLIEGSPLPDALPEGWVRRWAHLLEPDPPRFLHDPSPAFDPIPGREERDRRNRAMVGRLMDSLNRYWL
jgi:acetoin utilization protein AcuC